MVMNNTTYNQLCSNLEQLKLTQMLVHLDEITDFVIKTQKASASLLQRKFKIGYNKAATMIDTLEENGIIGPATGNSKPREVLITSEEDL